MITKVLIIKSNKNCIIIVSKPEDTNFVSERLRPEHLI